MFDKPCTIVGSGLFVCEQILFRPAEITSPFLKPAAQPEVVDYHTGTQAALIAFRAKQSKGIFSVSQQVLSRYAEKLIEVSRIIKESAYDAVLCPMRGARMPGLQGQLVTQSEPFHPFDGSDMAKRVNDDRILIDLRRLIHERPCAGEQRHIGVLDTAVGGDSCREMARLLRQVNDEGTEPWLVRFHLIHADDQYPSRSTYAYSSASKRLQIEIMPHAVTSLLIEDEPSLLGYDVYRGTGESHIFRFQQEGQILVHGPDGAKLYRRAPLDETMIALVSQEMMKLIQQMPDIRPVNLDHWPQER
jgi:hypothetical protein